MVSKFFSKNFIEQVFHDHIQYSPSSGIDGIKVHQYKNIIKTEASFISQKVISGDYKFSAYKQKLISKGATSLPRQISIPTIRDKIVLKILSILLIEKFKQDLNIELPQKVIRNIKKQTNNYDSFLKIDISAFYDNIKHKELSKRYWKRIRNDNLLLLLDKAVSTPTLPMGNKSLAKNEKGVPQGLSISNILAELYVTNIDRYFNRLPDIKYYRYVDDILILFNSHQVNGNDLYTNISQKFKKIGLKTHELDRCRSKSYIGTLKSESFDYLGYQFNPNSKISVRSTTIQKLHASIVNLFVSYHASQNKYDKNKRQTIEFLTWRLNIRITGCIFENKKKGWLFFFSEINDEKTLHQLDYFIAKLCKRFDVQEIQPKKFVKAFKELSLNATKTTYIPNFDEYTIDTKVHILQKYFKVHTDLLTEHQIEFEFRKKIDKQVRDLLEDIQDLS